MCMYMIFLIAVLRSLSFSFFHSLTLSFFCFLFLLSPFSTIAGALGRSSPLSPAFAAALLHHLVFQQGPPEAHSRDSGSVGAGTVYTSLFLSLYSFLAVFLKKVLPCTLPPFLSPFLPFSPLFLTTSTLSLAPFRPLPPRSPFHHIYQPKGSGNGMLQGVCSTFLQRLEPPLTVGGKKADALDKTNGSSSSSSSYKVASEPRPPRPWPSCRAFVRPSTFRLPPSLATPIVLVGPGTGIAPMRALLYERQHWVQQQQGGNGSDASVGPAVLYFGCKHQDCDFLYQDELSAFQVKLSSYKGKE